MTVIVVVVGYLGILLAIGFWSRRDSTTVAGYYVADKKLPGWVIAFSSNATGESAWLLLGLTGMGYLVGIHALWIVLGEVLGVALSWTLVALPFKEFTDRYQSITVPDYLEARFQDTGHLIRLISVGIILSMVTTYTAAQLTASGKAFSSFLGISYTTGVLIGAVVILCYTTLGGFKAVAYSDFLQGALMFVGLLVLPIVGITACGGWRPLMSQLRSIDPHLLEPMGDFGLSLEGVLSALGFVAIGLAFLGVPQILTRFISARGRNEIVQGSLLAVLCMIVFDTGAVLTGMAGRSLFPDLQDPETILPQMSQALFPAVFTAIFLVIVLAAIMSTVDSLLILASSAVVRDVIQKIIHPELPESRLALYGKLTTVIIGAGALILAMGEVRVIFWFVLFAWSGLASAFTPVILCSLFWGGTSRAGAVAGMLGGFLSTVLWVLLFKDQYYDLYEMIPGFAVGILLTVGVSLVTRPPAGAAQELQEVRASLRQPL